MADIKAQLEAANIEIAELKSANAALQSSNDLLTSEKTELMAANDQLAADNTALQAEVKKLLETPDEKEKESGVGGLFELNGNKYQVLVPSVTVPGIGKLTAIDLLADAKAQAILVASGSSVIKAVK